MMDFKSFLQLLVNVPKDLSGHFKVYANLLFHPSRFFHVLPANNTRNLRVALAFLFGNLVLSILLRHASLTPTDDAVVSALKTDLSGIWRYAIGVFVFSQLSSRLFPGVSFKRATTVMGFASVIFPAYSVVDSLLGNWAGASLYNLYISVFYGLLSSTTELKQSLVDLFGKACLISVAKASFWGWWVYILNIGIRETHNNLKLKARVYGLFYNNVLYGLLKGVVCGVMFVTIFSRMLSIYVDWENVKTAMAAPAPNYGEIMKTTSNICSSKIIPPRLLYLSSIHNAFAQTVLLFPKDPRVLEIKAKIISEAHQDAITALKKYISSKITNRSDPRMFLYYEIEGQLDKAEKAYADKAYFEGEQSWIVGVAETDIPFALFP